MVTIISKGDRVRIVTQEADITGIVQSAVNYGQHEHEDNWYVEMMADDGAHYWKQGFEPGFIQLVQPWQVEFTENTRVSDLYDKGKNTAFNSIVCTSNLIAVGAIPEKATLGEGNIFFVDTIHGDCSKCPAEHACVICKFNE